MAILWCREPSWKYFDFVKPLAAGTLPNLYDLEHLEDMPETTLAFNATCLGIMKDGQIVKEWKVFLAQLDAMLAGLVDVDTSREIMKELEPEEAGDDPGYDL